MTRIRYVGPQELVRWFDDGSIEHIAIIDVREADYVTGRVKGSLHYPFHKLTEHLPELVAMAATKRTIIFHCHFSQTRGPRAAKLLSMELPEEEATRVCVLEGGWKTWQTLCHHTNRLDLIEPVP